MATLLFSGTISFLAEFKSAENWIILCYKLYNYTKCFSAKISSSLNSIAAITDLQHIFKESEFSKPQIPQEKNVVWPSAFTEMESEAQEA